MLTDMVETLYIQTKNKGLLFQPCLNPGPRPIHLSSKHKAVIPKLDSRTVENKLHFIVIHFVMYKSLAMW